MTQYQTDEKARRRRHLVDQAISLAMQNRWQEAVNVNRSIIELYSNDVDALNRLGRALTELGQYAEAKEAYGKAVEYDPNNTIARKNLARLATINVPAEPVKAKEKVDPRIFVAETGKSGITSLVRLAPKPVIAKMAVGDQVYLKIEGRALLVMNSSEEMLGQVEPRLSQRLIDLIKGGNRYAAAIVAIDETQIRVIIRETHQDPSQAGKVSFPSKGTGERAYIKDSILRYELEDEEEEEIAEETEVLGEGHAETEEGEEVELEEDVDEFEEEEEDEEEASITTRLIRPAAAAKASTKEQGPRPPVKPAGPPTRPSASLSKPVIAPMEQTGETSAIDPLSIDQEVPPA